MGIEFNPENVNLNYDGKSSGKKVTPQNQNQVGSTEIGDLLRKNSKETSSSDLVDKMIRDFNKLPKIEKYILKPDGTKVPYAEAKELVEMPDLSPRAASLDETPQIIREPDGQRYIILPDGTKVPYVEAKELVEMPQIITEIDGQRYVVDENGVLVRPPAPEIPIYREHETPPVPVTPIYRVYDNDDFVSLDSPLGRQIMRPTDEFNPNIDGKYKPVYEEGGGHKIIGFEPYKSSDLPENMISLDSELGQKIAEHFKALDDRKTNGSPAIIGEKQEYDNYEPIYENVVNTTGSQPKIIGYREKTDAEKQGSVDY